MADTKQINSTVDTFLVNEIIEEAAAEGRSFSWMVAKLLAEAMEARKRAKKGL